MSVRPYCPSHEKGQAITNCNQIKESKVSIFLAPLLSLEPAFLLDIHENSILHAKIKLTRVLTSLRNRILSSEYLSMVLNQRNFLIYYSIN